MSCSFRPRWNRFTHNPHPSWLLMPRSTPNKQTGKRGGNTADSKRRRCATERCRGVATPLGKSPYCAKCRSRRWKARYPLKYSYAKLRYRAKERGHEFQLTFEEYRSFAIATGYAFLKGKTAKSLSINRKNHSLGYKFDNIESVTLSENSKLRYSPRGWF